MANTFRWPHRGVIDVIKCMYVQLHTLGMSTHMYVCACVCAPMHRLSYKHSCTTEEFENLMYENKMIK